MLVFKNKKFKRTKKYYKRCLQEAKLTKEHCDVVNKYLALTCPANKPVKDSVVNKVTSS